MTKTPDPSPEQSAARVDGRAAAVAGRATEGMARNVLANWSGHFLIVVSGFVLPRLINDQIGQERLGVWDFGWSAVAYLSLLTTGIGSSVNRFVARHRAMADWEGLNRSTSSSAGIFLTTGAVAAAITVALTILLPRFLPESFTPYVREAQWVVLFLGLASAVSMPAMVYHGVISGCRRYDVAMYAEAGSHLLIIAGIVTALLMGGGLAPLAIIVFAGRSLEGFLKYRLAHRVCPELSMTPRLVTLASIKELAFFGGKYFLTQIARIFMYQGNSMLVAFFVGPAAMPVYARSIALVLHADKLLFQFARVLIPTASNAQAGADNRAMTTLALNAARCSTFIALPVVMILVILGGSLLRIWMGAQYAKLPLLEILALGHLAGLTQAGAFYTLLGMGRHGRPALAMLVAAVVCVAASWVCLGVFHLGLTSVAVSIAVCVFCVNAFVIPVVIARSIDVPVTRYIHETLVQALAPTMPFALCLLVARYTLAPHDVLVLLVGIGFGGLVLAACYWNMALPKSIKDRLTGRMRSWVPDAFRT